MNTALHVWKYTEEVLLQQGSWKDPETVRRFYSGITDQTLAQAIHGWDSAVEIRSPKRDSRAAIGDAVTPDSGTG